MINIYDPIFRAELMDVLLYPINLNFTRKYCWPICHKCNSPTQESYISASHSMICIPCMIIMKERISEIYNLYRIIRLCKSDDASILYKLLPTDMINKISKYIIC